MAPLRYFAALILVCLLGEAGAAQLVGSVPSVGGPIAVNSVTNQIFVLSNGELRAIDGSSHAAVRLATGISSLEAVGVNPVTNRVYVGNAATHSILAYTGTNANPDVISLPSAAMAINPSADEIYVTNPDGGSLGVIHDDGVSAPQVSSIPLAGHADAIAVNPVTNRVYVALREARQLVVLDGATKAVLDTIGLPSGLQAAIAVNAVTNRIYALTAGAPSKVTVVDGATHATSSVDAETNAFAIEVDPAANRIYVANYGFEPGAGALPSGSVMVIDGATHAVSSTASGVVNNPIRLLVDSARGFVYVQQGTRWPGIAVMDTQTGAVTNLGGGGSTGIQMNPVTNRIYAGGGNTLWVYDANTYSVSPVVPDPGNYEHVAVNPLTDLAYAHFQPIVVNPVTGRTYRVFTDTLQVTDASGNTVASVPLPGFGVEVVVNSVTNRIYVSVVSTPLDLDRIVVVDGATNATHSFHVARPAGMAVNEATNTIYVLSPFLDALTVVDGRNETTRVLPLDSLPNNIAVNPATNTVFITARRNGGLVKVIDGASLSVTNVPIAVDESIAIAVNSVANKAYVVHNNGTATVLDGATLRARNVPAGLDTGSTGYSGGVAVDPIANRAYVAYRDNSVTVIDGATDGTITVPLPSTALDVAVNPANGKAYVTTSAGGFSITPARTVSTNHAVQATLAGGPVTNQQSPVLALSACCPYSPIDPAVEALRYRADSHSVFDLTGGPAPLPGLRMGMNFVEMFSADASGTKGLGISAPTRFPLFSVAPTITAAMPMPFGHVGLAYSATLSASGGIGELAFSVDPATPLPDGLNLSAAGELSGIPTAAGFFAFEVRIADENGGSGRATVAITVLGASASLARLANISTRMSVSATDVGIAGFVIGGTQPKTVVVTAKGPSLARYGISAPLANPRLKLTRLDGSVVVENDDWASSGNAAKLQAAGFAPASPLDAALLVENLAPGAYTAIVESADGGSGIAIVEAYEITRPDIPFINISTRAFVATGEGVMIGGLVIQGDAPLDVVLTAKGPSLASSGIANPLSDPMITVVRASDGAVVATNDDWATDPNAFEVQASGFAPSNAKEAAVFLSLPPGAYTAVVQGANGATGVGIVEAYKVQRPSR